MQAEEPANLIARIGQRGDRAKVAPASQLRQAVDMLGELYDAVLDEKTEARDKASCARAWDSVAERIRILRGQPMPGVLRPEAKVKGRRTGSRASPIETAGKEPANEVAHQPMVVPSPDSGIAKTG